MTPVLRHRPGEGPLLVSMPHVGTFVPDNILKRLAPAARALPDTDWHVGRLYGFLDDMGVARIEATHSRYVVDLNRSEEGGALYPGQAETGLVPTETFDGVALYVPGDAPTAEECARRIETYWRPYHALLRRELEARVARHGYAVLWDAHSIRSRVPRLFEGCLPDLNFGTAGGASAAPGLAEGVMEIANKSKDYSAVLNGRFKGGFITRHYGKPQDGVHAVQLELAQTTYMDEEPPYAFDADKAAQLRPLLKTFVEAVRNFRP